MIDPAPDALSADGRLPIGFPSWREIGGAIAAVIPFGASMATTRASWENGRLVDYHHRDWIALGGGGAAVIFAGLALIALGRTEAARKLIRTGAAIAILGLGGFQIARGIGVVGRPGSPSGGATAPSIDRPRGEVEPAPAAVDAAAGPAIDLVATGAAVDDFFARWRAGDLDGIYAAGHPDLRAVGTARRVRRTLELITEVLGPVGEVVERKVAADPDRADAVVATGTAGAARGTALYRLRFVPVDGALRLVSFNVTVPDELMPAVPNADAGALAKRAIEAIVARDLPALRETLTPKVDDEMTEALSVQFFDQLKPIGKVRSVAITKQQACEDDDEGQCVELTIAGKRGTIIAKVEAQVLLSRWLISYLHLGDPT